MRLGTMLCGLRQAVQTHSGKTPRAQLPVRMRRSGAEGSMRYALLFAALVLPHAARADCEAERQQIVDTLMKPDANKHAREVYDACIARERAAGDPDCAAASEDANRADLARRMQGADDSAAQQALKECLARRDARRNTPERARITYSAAICGYELRANGFARANHAAMKTGTVRGRMWAEDHAGNVKAGKIGAAILRRRAAKKHIRLMSCSDKHIARLARCLSLIDADADCSTGPEADYVDDANEIMASSDDPQ